MGSCETRAFPSQGLKTRAALRETRAEMEFAVRAAEALSIPVVAAAVGDEEQRSTVKMMMHSSAD